MSKTYQVPVEHTLKVKTVVTVTARNTYEATMRVGQLLADDASPLAECEAHLREMISPDPNMDNLVVIAVDSDIAVSQPSIVDDDQLTLEPQAETDEESTLAGG